MNQISMIIIVPSIFNFLRKMTMTTGVLFIDVEADDDGVVDIDDQGDDGVEKE